MPGKTWRCRACRQTEKVEGKAVPERWFMLRRSCGYLKPSIPLGVVCSVACLLQTIPHLGFTPPEAKAHIAQAAAEFKIKQGTAVRAVLLEKTVGAREERTENVDT